MIDESRPLRNAVREVERRIRRSRGAMLPTPDLTAVSFRALRLARELMYELQWLAYRADITRVVTFMLDAKRTSGSIPESASPRAPRLVAS